MRIDNNYLWTLIMISMYSLTEYLPILSFAFVMKKKFDIFHVSQHLMEEQRAAAGAIN